MSAGTKIVQMRGLIRTLTPYLDHRSDCMIRGALKRCTCNYAAVLAQAQRMANTDVAHTGAPFKRRTTNDAGAL